MDTDTAREQKQRIGTQGITSIPGLKSRFRSEQLMYADIDKSVKERAKGRKIVLNNLEPLHRYRTIPPTKKEKGGPVQGMQ